MELTNKEMNRIKELKGIVDKYETISKEYKQIQNEYYNLTRRENFDYNNIEVGDVIKIKSYSDFNIGVIVKIYNNDLTVVRDTHAIALLKDGSYKSVLLDQCEKIYIPDIDENFNPIIFHQNIINALSIFKNVESCLSLIEEKEHERLDNDLEK